MKIALLACFLPLLHASSACGQCVRYEDHLRWLTTVTLPGTGQVEDIVIDGTRAYVAAQGIYGLHVMDISTPAAPVPLHRVHGSAYGLATGGGCIYLTRGSLGLDIYRVPDGGGPPVRMATFDTAGFASHVALAGTFALVADGEAGIVVIDISNPASPTLAALLDTPGRTDRIRIVGSRVFVADDSGGLRIVDIADPYAPANLGSLALPFAYDVAIQGSYAFVTAIGRMHVVDISDPALPTLVTTFVPGPRPYMVRVTLSGGLAHVIDLNWGLRVVDVREPAAPALLGTIATPFGAGALAQSEHLAYVGSGGGGLVVFDVKGSTSPEPLGSVSLSYDGRDCAIVGNTLLAPTYACTSYGSYGCQGALEVVDVSDPTHPVHGRTVPVSGLPTDIDVSADRAYVTQRPGSGEATSTLLVFDTSSITDPVVIGTASGAAFSRVAAQEPFVYVGSDLGALLTYDVVSPRAPTLVSSVPLPGPCTDMALSSRVFASRHLFVTCEAGGLAAFDLSDPALPLLIGILDTPNRAYAVDISGNLAFVADYTSSFSSALHTVDVSSPENMRVLGSHLLNGAVDVAIVSKCAYVVERTTGIQVLDVREPAAPTILGCLSSDWYLGGITAGDGHVVVWRMAWTGRQMYVLPAECEETALHALPLAPSLREDTFSELYTPSPNPSRGMVTLRFTAPARSRVSLGVFDVSGRLVRLLLPKDSSTSSERDVRWDGRNDSGDISAAGVYFVRLSVKGPEGASAVSRSLVRVH